VLFPGRDKEWDDIVYICWYAHVMGSILGLEFYNADQKKWGQAHLNGRHVITAVLLEGAKDFIRIKEVVKDGKPYLYIGMDRNKIKSSGKEALGNFLKRLQVYKSTADPEGLKMFEAYSQVSETFLNYKKIIELHKRPRRLELQCDLKIEGDQIHYTSYPETFEGIIESYMDHYRYNVDEVFAIWKEHKESFKLR